MNILQFAYDSQTKMYNQTVNVVDGGVWLSGSFWSKFYQFGNKVAILYSLLKILQ